MNARNLLVGLSLGLALPACSDDTGILVEVFGDQLRLAVARLDTMVIVDDGTGAVPSVVDWGGSDSRQDTIAGDLDLRTAPYRVLFRPDGVARDATVWVAALAYDGAGAVIGWGELPGPIAFVPDLVKKVELSLSPALAVGNGCIVKDGRVVVRTHDDCDGDEVPYHVDCDDLDAQVAGDLDGDPVVCGGDCDQDNAQVYPGNREVCDGVDNDCDPTTRPLPELCVTVEREVDVVNGCSVGQRQCTEPEGTGYGPCSTSPVELAANDQLCARWAECLEAGQGESCLVDGALRCKLKTGSGGPCLDATAPLHELIPDGATSCTVRLIGSRLQGGWNVGVRARGSSVTPGGGVSSCDPELVVTVANLVPQIFVLEAVVDGNVRVVSVAVGHKRSDCAPDHATELECELASP